jgi:hypothetical protein
MALDELFKNLFSTANAKLLYYPIPPTHVDRPLEAIKAVAGQHYFRVFMAEMFLHRKSQWLTRYYPAVYSLVRCNFGNKTQEFPNVADTSRVGLQKRTEGDIVGRNFELTPLLPFNGGTVKIDAGLVAVAGTNGLNKLTGVLSNFAGMLNVPQISAVLQIAQPVATGMQELFGGGDGELHLGFQDTFSSDTLQSGYLAVIRADANDGVDPDELWVVKGALHEGQSIQYNRPFERYDHMLIRIEVLKERDDWRQLISIQNPFQDALLALKNENKEKAKLNVQQALYQAMVAPELIPDDHVRVSNALKAEYNKAKQILEMESLGLESLDGQINPDVDLGDLMSNAAPPEPDTAQADNQLADILAFG